MFANIFQPLIDVAEAILIFFHDHVGLSWGFAIMGLTVVVRSAILPLTFKQVRSMQAMQQLQPQMKELQQRYKDDRQRMNQEVMKLYQEHEVNPLGSCLPLVLQLPFFLALFYLQQSEGFRVEVRDTGAALGQFVGGDPTAATHVGGGEKFFFIPDLTVPATGAVLIVLIVIYISTQLASSLVSASVMTDKNQKRLILALPFVFTPFIINFPTGLLVYWITTNTWTIGQQLLIRKVLPPPHLKEAREAGEAKPSKGPFGRLAEAFAGAEGRAEEAAHLGGAGKERGASESKQQAGSDGRKAARSGGGGAKAASGGGAKAASGGGAKAASGRGATRAKKGSGDGGAKASGDAANGGPRKAPPPSPRKKKKRSGRRR
jgi:YidC/Oxa1 family membrane protein insertase